MLIRQSPSGPSIKLPSFAAVADNVNVGAVASVDFSKGPAQRLTLSANTTLTITGLPAGQPTWWQLKVVQDNTGGHSLAVAGAKTPGGTGLTLSTAGNSVDIVSGYWDGTTNYASVAGLAFS